jgi:uncharacterized cupredoxin-like copper-binding protein
VRYLLAVLASLTVAVTTTAAGYILDDGNPAAAEALGPGAVTVLVDIEHSRFEPSYVRVAAGTEVHFVVSNDDPINHELIVGPADVHARHRDGTEPHHEPRNGELSVGPDEQAVTSYVFDEPGTVEMACHLPGHYAFGMRGTVEVVAVP